MLPSSDQTSKGLDPGGRPRKSYTGASKRRGYIMQETETVTVRLEGNPFPLSFTRGELREIVQQAAELGITAQRRRYCGCQQPTCSDPAPNVAHKVGVRA